MKIRIFSSLSAFIHYGFMSFKAKTELRKRKDFYIELTIDDIRSMFCFSDTEYKKTNDLKRFVIEPALKEINDQTDLSITDIQF